MKKRFKIKGLDCPNCAKTLETKICELESVENAKIDFLKSTLELEADNIEKAVSDSISIAKVIEPNAKIIVKDEKHKIFGKKFFIDLSLLILGIAVGLVALLVEMPVYVFWILFVLSALLMGYKTYLKSFMLLFKKTINENLLITISVFGAAAVGEFMDSLMVIALYSIGKILENLALEKSRKSIEKLTNLKPETVVRLNGENEEIVSPSEIKIGDIFIVKPGERVAIDGIIVEGNSNLDVQSLTGESLPKFVQKGDQVLSGSIVLTSVLKIEATANLASSTAQKIMDMIENASEKKAKTETIISKITKWYTLGVVLLAILVCAIVWAVTKDLNTAIYRGLIFLVVSCPCAFAISVPLAYFSGIGNASKRGILIKGSNYLDETANLKTIAFDKTGTLTTGEFKIKKIVSICEKSEEEILQLCAFGEAHSLHPIAKTIANEFKGEFKEISNFKEISGEGISFEFEEQTYFVGRKSENLIETTVELYNENNKLGEIVLEDEIKRNAKTSIAKLQQMGIKTIMLSGDNKIVVEKVAKEIGIDKSFSNLLPENKFKLIEQEKENKNKIGYVGDGLNDAPSLTLANVGFSMGLRGNDASVEASDIVLANDNPEKIVEAIEISKFTKKIVWENIGFSALIKIVFLSLGAFGITGMLSAVIADVGVTLLAILNSLRALKFNPKLLKKKH